MAGDVWPWCEVCFPFQSLFLVSRWENLFANLVDRVRRRRTRKESNLGFGEPQLAFCRDGRAGRLPGERTGLLAGSIFRAASGRPDDLVGLPEPPGCIPKRARIVVGAKFSR